jgi:cytochrome c biogenesis protein CcdA/thiol-disulfide isomerase/thioredoxin
VIVLMAFALVAGAGTALSPCVLPVLPIALSAGSTGDRRRPLGIATGLALSFTFATVALVYVIHWLGLPDGLVRTLAIVALMLFGASLLVPPASARLEAWLSRLPPRLRSPRSGSGLGSGLLVGISLGLVYAPCAGPILAGVITASASQSFTAGRLGVALAYGVGSALALYALLLGGRRLSAPLARRSARLQIAMGAVMVCVGALMLADYDLRFQSAIAKHLPAVLVDPARSIEKSSAATRRLADVRGRRRALPRAAEASHPPSGLPVLGAAPEFTDNQSWFNTPGGRPLTLRGLRGRVVLVDFWTYTCINCLRTLPYLKSWDSRYRHRGLTIVGVHTPEFPFEKSASNVRAAIAANGLRYPVAQDNDDATWNAYGNQYWPAKYLIDAAGRVRYTHFGEGEYLRTESAIRSLLDEAGRAPGATLARTRAEAPSAGLLTPESYLGSAQAARFANGAIAPGTRDFGQSHRKLSSGELRFRGRWRITPEAAQAQAGAALDLSFHARRVFVVLGTSGQPGRMRLLLDGRPIGDGARGADVRAGAATVSSQRLYRLVELPRVEDHLLTLEPAAGTSGYAFTFG